MLPPSNAMRSDGGHLGVATATARKTGSASKRPEDQQHGDSHGLFKGLRCPPDPPPGGGGMRRAARQPMAPLVRYLSVTGAITLARIKTCCYNSQFVAQSV